MLDDWMDPYAMSDADPVMGRRHHVMAYDDPVMGRHHFHRHIHHVFHHHRY